MSSVNAKVQPRWEIFSQFFVRSKRFFDEYLLFCMVLPVAVYVMLFVPQIKNIWWQGPPPYPVHYRVGYYVFIALVMGGFWFSWIVMLGWPKWLSAGGHKGWLDPRLWLYYLCYLGCWFPDRIYNVLLWAISAPEPDVAAPAGGPSLAALIKLLGCQEPWGAAPPDGASESHRRLRPWLKAWGVLFLSMGAAIFWFGASGDSGRLYPLAGAFCQIMGMLFVLLGSWASVAAFYHNFQKSDRLIPIELYQVRLLGWFFLTAVSGECLWFFATRECCGQVFSYRLYTIWGIVELLVTILLLALLADRWDRATQIWPIRVLFLVLVVSVVWWKGGPAVVSENDFLIDCTKEQRDTWRQASIDDSARLDERNQAWFTDCEAQIQQIKQTSQDRGPFIIVAASGGGSRAAIFTALALETLGRTPLQTDKPILAEDEIDPQVPTWANNVLFISGVSGGSLATAYYVQRLGSQQPSFQAIPDLHNTTKTELIHRLHNRARGGIENFLEKKSGFPQPAIDADKAREDWENRIRELQAIPKRTTEEESELADGKIYLDLLWSEWYWQELMKVDGDENNERLREEFRKRPELQRARWILRSGAMDAMCMDFMAPLFRSLPTLTLDRGDALARFWTEQFGWKNSTNISGYQAPITSRNYGTSTLPLVLFNASDVAKGSRLAVGFPPLPSDLWAKVYPDASDSSRQPKSFERPKTFAELQPAHRISLARAVRMSSNFPWGFHVMEFPVQDPKQSPIHVLDGGVVDNSGLDTLYELFHALEWYETDERAKNHPYQAHARAILNDLRQLGVVILEIDSGGKLSRSGSRGPLAGVLEPTDALNNAAFTNSERIKHFYLAEIRRILTPNLHDLNGRDLQAATLLTPFNAQLSALPLNVYHVQFQCNHINEDKDTAKRDVMTAWALGPDDKAEVIARFLAELGSWDTDKRRVIDYLADYRQGFQYLHRQAEALLHGESWPKAMRQAGEETQKLGKLVEQLITTDAKKGKRGGQLIANLQKQLTERKKKNQQLAEQIVQLEKNQAITDELSAINRLLERQLNTLQQLQTSKTTVQGPAKTFEMTVPERTPAQRRLPPEAARKKAVDFQEQLDSNAAKARQLLQMRPVK